MTAAERASSEAAWIAELATAFASRRCRCGAVATCVYPGHAELREAGVLLCAAVPARGFCLEHAMPVRRAA